ncbi:hypothetical protein J1605_014662 [Eschrichtius robustus]|uniref:Cadherin domain-containing protein n=1 Tax=Eschrichtius robustus TaxID=9764 RepID=A0AB34GCT7_ESCRO|nr:hypothetical protein J1605_014662 [Eschrichtius robustus]
MLFSRRGGQGGRCLLLSLLLFTACGAGSSQIHYSVREEAKHGTFVGRIAQDLGLELAELVSYLFWVASKSHGDFLEVNLQNGILFVNSRIDREELCKQNTKYSIHLEVIVDRPLQVLHVEVEVKDINDNPQVFRVREQRLFIPESRLLDSRFPIEGAADADIGTNAFLTYTFSSSDYFSLDVQASGELSKSLSPELRKSVDREDTPELRLLLTASDGGKPELEGTVQLLIMVLNINDNALWFAQAVYRVHLLDTTNVPANGTLMTTLNASDADKSVTCTLTPHVPFKLVSTFKNYYSLVLDSALDRESVANYEVGVTARDGGSPSLSATASLSVEVADMNDNAPAFAQPEYTVLVKENNPPGCHIFTVSARDADAQENALVSYSLVERRVGERALSSYVSVHAESGKVYALQPLDHEELELLQFQVSARDAGVPPLGSNVTLQVFVLDENDNQPALLLPGTGGGAGALSQRVARSVGAGHVVAKVRAVDADSGYNAWLSYELQPAAGGARSPFRVGLYTGEISTTRALDEADAPRQRLLVLVKDHGEPALTATATVLLSLEDSGQAPKASSRASTGAAGAEAALVDVNVYLIIAICAVSSLLVLTLLLYTALRRSAPPSEGACGPGKPTLVCSSEVGSWSYSQQRRQRVCSGGGGPPKTNLMAFSPGLCPDLST